MPQGISSILISLVNHPLSGTAALISRLKEKSIPWVCVAKMKNSDEPVGNSQPLVPLCDICILFA